MGAIRDLQGVVFAEGSAAAPAGCKEGDDVYLGGGVKEGVHPFFLRRQLRW